MATDLGRAARDLIKSLDVLSKAIENYGTAALAIGRQSENATARGLDARQIRQRLKAEVIARLSPRGRFGEPGPWLQLDGAPEARRYVAANPLPGSV